MEKIISIFEESKLFRYYRYSIEFLIIVKFHRGINGSIKFSGKKYRSIEEVEKYRRKDFNFFTLEFIKHFYNQ